MATKKLLERVREALPQDEHFIAAFESEPSSASGNKPIAPMECRPSVFEGMARPSDTYGTVFSLLYRIITNEVFPSSAPVYSDPAQREECKQKNRVFYGGWGSEAGQLTAALQPRSKTGVISLLALTGYGLRIVYIQRRRGSMYRLRSGSELGWAYPLDQLSWIRKCAGKNVEFGFRDGSWTTLVVHTDQELQQYFPAMLPETAGIPW